MSSDSIVSMNGNVEFVDRLDRHRNRDEEDNEQHQHHVDKRRGVDIGHRRLAAACPIDTRHFYILSSYQNVLPARSAVSRRAAGGEPRFAPMATDQRRSGELSPLTVVHAGRSGRHPASTLPDWPPRAAPSPSSGWPPKQSCRSCVLVVAVFVAGRAELVTSSRLDRAARVDVGEQVGRENRSASRRSACCGSAASYRPSPRAPRPAGRWRS